MQLFQLLGCLNGIKLKKYTIMKKVTLLWIACFCMGLAFAQGVKTATLDSIMQAYTQQNAFTGNILAYEKGKKVFSKSYGYVLPM